MQILQNLSKGSPWKKTTPEMSTKKTVLKNKTDLKEII
jgi:hypothetical protein